MLDNAKIRGPRHNHRYNTIEEGNTLMETCEICKATTTVEHLDIMYGKLDRLFDEAEAIRVWIRNHK